MNAKILGRVRGLQEGNYPDNREDEQFHVNMTGERAIAQCLPEYSELSRMGESYMCIGGGITSLIVLPTTVAQLFLHNQEPHTQKSYAISHVGILNASAAAAALQLQVFVQVGITPVAVAASAVAIKSLNGRMNYRGNARARASVTVTNDGWHNVGNSMISGNVAANPSLAYLWDVRGRYLIPPGGSFGLTAVGNAATTCTVWVIWNEVMAING